jgi:uncharacterized phage protein (TIGR01671 family)
MAEGMREILFRGKREDNGEWVYGGYMKNSRHNIVAIWAEKDDGTSYGHEVIPETVGQFTGLIDKNGVKIFEGDIVKTAVKIISGQAETVVHVFFSELCASFMLAGGILCGPEFIHKNGKYAVIGNIHDTPDLLN